MWNEPNYIGALRPQRKAGKPISPTTYTGILNTGYAEIGRVERERKLKLDVLGGAMNRGFGGEGSISPLIFLRGMKKAKATFDIASLHPYPITGRVGFNDGTLAPNITLSTSATTSRSSTGSGRPSATRCGSRSTASSRSPTATARR